MGLIEYFNMRRGVSMSKKNLFFLALMMIGSQQMHALTKKQVAFRAMAAGLGVTVFKSYTYQGVEFLSRDEVVFAGASSFFAWIFSHWTAKSRFRWVQKQFDKLESSSLYTTEMHDANIAYLLQDSGCEYKDLSLIEAFECLRSYDRTLRNMEEQLIKAIEDAGRHTELGGKLRKLLKRAAQDLSRVRANETFIKNHDKTAWTEQWKVHQKRKRERERFRQQSLLTMCPQPNFHGHYVYHHGR